eukprot:CAMPEP_0174700598 /NCGR_PEP_ID=MMETSP1094-20130205/5509_1 /TAXON_ID=156173 /ORGANISM="Chrysochromulina brevifilum, Strain UTEX LB 985" /LENGTH=76 /DNA_ID=CAMNT_0015898109 /DNA_START=200 /DNA_END=430 /DNA_ORIENTATION=+
MGHRRQPKPHGKQPSVTSDHAQKASPVDAISSDLPLPIVGDAPAEDLPLAAAGAAEGTAGLGSCVGLGSVLGLWSM